MARRKAQILLARALRYVGTSRRANRGDFCATHRAALSLGYYPRLPVIGGEKMDRDIGPSPWTTSPAKKFMPRSAQLRLCFEAEVDDAIRFPSSLAFADVAPCQPRINKT
jgi:hypothetical protein